METPEKIVNKGKINRMCKYFRGKKVVIRYEYNNSLGHHSEHTYGGVYDAFILNELDYGSGREYSVVFKLKGRQVFEQHFGYWATFTGLGAIRECNSGPYCYFTIVRTRPLINKILKILKLWSSEGTK